VIGEGLVERIAELEAEVELLRAQLERERSRREPVFLGQAVSTAVTGAAHWAELARKHRDT
jgi:hypothetical protein